MDGLAEAVCLEANALIALQEALKAQRFFEIWALYGDRIVWDGLGGLQNGGGCTSGNIRRHDWTQRDMISRSKVKS